VGPIGPLDAQRVLAADDAGVRLALVAQLLEDRAEEIRRVSTMVRADPAEYPSRHDGLRRPRRPASDSKPSASECTASSQASAAWEEALRVGADRRVDALRPAPGPIRVRKRSKRSKDLSILEGLESDLAEIEAALARIDDGTYGVDEVTAGRSIPSGSTHFHRAHQRRYVSR